MLLIATDFEVGGYPMKNQDLDVGECDRVSANERLVALPGIDAGVQSTSTPTGSRGKRRPRETGEGRVSPCARTGGG